MVGLQAACGIVVTHNGPNDATGVVLGETLPAGWTVAGVASTQGACTTAEASVSCALGNLAYGAQAGITLIVVPNGPGSVTSAAAVAGVQGDPNFTNNVSAGTTIVHRFGCWVFGSDGGVFASDGGVFAFGDAGFFGSTGNAHLNAPIVAMSSTPTGKGYWLVASDGGVFPFGDAGSFGDLSGRKLGAAIVGMAGTPSGHGYWLVASNGGVFPFGDAPFLGSMAGPRLNKPMIGLTPNV